ncbi:MAG TPA: hypothetical protein VEC99_00020, partial [Clostridia bacterium]|nr:hypothetical protein [Clostridia bacterium]
VAGVFSELGGVSHTNIGRLQATDPATDSLSFDQSSITWLRGGTSPEVSWTSFEVSSNGSNWASLGTGKRIPGGWRLDGIEVPTNVSVRARGFVMGGYHSGSGWFVERIISGIHEPRIQVGTEALVITNEFRFNISGVSGKEVVIEASTNLHQWLPLHTNNPTSDLLEFGDTGRAQTPHRFYRAKLHSQ